MRIVRSKLPTTGFKVSGLSISNIRYADDTTLLENNKKSLEDLAREVKHESLKFGQKINEAKTNVMSMNGFGNVRLGDAEIDKVEQFKYLGSMIKTDAPSSHEIRIRLAIARGAASDLNPIWADKELSLKLKKRVAQSLVWSIATYGCEVFL